MGGKPSPNITTTEEFDGFVFRVVGLEKEDTLLSSLESKGVQLEGRRDVSMVELKALAADFLDRRSMLRLLVLAEPDFLSREHALAKVLVFARVFYQELSTK